MTEQELYQQQQAQTQTRSRPQDQTAEAQAAVQEPAKATGRVCKYCLSRSPAGMKFCTNCGEEFGGVEIICETCQKATTKEDCPICQRRLKPYTCPKCGKQTTSEVCECGETLSPLLVKVTAMAMTETTTVVLPQELTEAEAASIEQVFAQQQDSEAFQEFVERLIQRDIMKRERRYDKEMEERILRVNGPKPFSVTLPDPAEQAARFRAYSFIERSITEKRKKIMEEEIRALYPVPPPPPDNSAALKAEEDRLEAELAAERSQMEQKFAALLAKTDSDINAFHEEEERKRLEAERKRIEEEQRREAERLAKIEAERQAAFKAKREAEERARAIQEAERIRIEQERERARQQKEAEAYANRYLGHYHTRFDNGSENLFIRSRTDAIIEGKIHHTKYQQICSVKVQGSDIEIKEYGVAFTPRKNNTDPQKKFKGNINESGTKMQGFWIDSDAGLFEYFKKG